MPNYSDISYEIFKALIQPFINDKGTRLEDKKKPISVKDSLRFVPKAEDDQIVSFDLKKGKLFMTDMSKGRIDSEEVTGHNFQNIWQNIWNEKTYFMIERTPCYYLPFKQIVEKIQLDQQELSENIQTTTKLIKEISLLIAEYLQPDTDEIIQALTSRGFFEEPTKTVTSKDVCTVEQKNIPKAKPCAIL